MKKKEIGSKKPGVVFCEYALFLSRHYQSGCGKKNAIELK